MKIQLTIEQKLMDAFSPVYLTVENESSNHNVPAGSESHFKVVIVSETFEGQRLLPRHKAVNACLAEELQEHIHALAMHTYTESEWIQQHKVPVSPNCLGGSKGDETLKQKL